MGHELLCGWLEIAPDSWPPDYYALLGLPPGEGTTDEIEQRVLERMEKLRHYQLMHPELVTEGMNLLAQAMITLSRAVSGRASQAGRGSRDSDSGRDHRGSSPTAAAAQTRDPGAAAGSG